MCATSAHCAPAAADGAWCQLPRRASTSRTSRRPSLDRTSDAVTCENIGGTLGSRGISAVH
eukprot:2189108-Prymnesium_polylepis.1